MPELAITVSAPGTPPRTYVFPEGRIAIGRAPDCHVSVCHEAVSRKLFFAWLEEGGTRVRVEERPGLTNPLMNGGSPVVGGVCARRLVLTAGPVVFELFPKAEGARAAPGTDAVKKRRRVLALVAGALFACAVVAVASADRGAKETTFALKLPESPFDSASMLEEPEGGKAAAERANILYSRARQLLRAPKRDAAMKVRAARLIARAAALHADTGDEAAARSKTAEAEVLRLEIEEEYRRATVDLRRCLERGGREASHHARRVLEYLAGVEFDSRGALERLAIDPEEEPS